jgi:hypothetical protein
MENEHMQTDLTLASSQLGAVTELVNAQTAEETAAALEGLREAYAGLEDAQEIINQLEAGTLSLDEANEQLSSTTLKTGRNVGKMTD